MSQLNQTQANRPNPPELTKEDNTWINTRAAEMAKSTPREQMSKIVESMDPRVRQSLTEKKIDPIIYHFRMKATKEFRMRQQAAMGMNMNRMQTPNPAANVPVTQAQTPFMGNLDQFGQQQQEGIRQQQEGQLVVPASQNQNNHANDPMTQQQKFILMQLRQANPQASGQELRQMYAIKQKEMQARLQARNQLNGQMQMQGQNIMGAMPQPSRPMSTLNQPMNQGQAVGSPAMNIQRPQSRPPNGQVMNQGLPGQPQQPQQQPQLTVQQIANGFSSLPPQVQQQLSSRPKHEWPGFMAAFRRRQQHEATQRQQQMIANNTVAMQRSASQQAQSMQGNQAMQQMPNQQFSGPPTMQPSLSAGADQPNMMAGMPSQLQPQANNAQTALRLQQQQQQQQMQQQQMQQNANAQGRPGQQQNQMIPLLIRETDGLPLTQETRQKTEQFYMQNGITLPPLTSWHQLKEFVKSNPGPNPPLQAIQKMQLQYASLRRQAQAQQQQQAGMPQAMQQQQQPPNAGLQAQNMAQQGSGMGGQPQPSRQITPQMIEAAKRQNPGWHHMREDQIVQLLQSGRPQQNTGQAQNQAQVQAQQQSQNNTKIPAQQRPASQVQQQNRSQSQNQNQSQAPAAAKQAENKSLKRPNQDDTSEPVAPAQNKPWFMSVTKEDFDKFPPEKKAQFMQERKRYEAASKVAQLSKEINSQMTKTPPITSMDQQSRQKIIKMLTSEGTKKILERFDTFLIAFSQTESDQELLKTLIRHKWYLAQQFKPETWQNKSYQPADNFTLAVENIEKILATVSNKFQQALTKQAPQMQQNAAQQSMPLTQENLLMATNQAANQQKVKGQKAKDGPPPAPTVDKPPFQFPSDRGQGAPQYAPKTGLKAEDLKLPPKKKLRNESSASPVTPSQPPPPRMVVKCPVPGCSTQPPQGFSSQAELEHHRSTVHRPEMESVKDPVGYLNNSLQQAFNLNENMEPKKFTAGGKPMEKTLSQGVKVENKPATPVSMARGVSGQGRKVTPSTPRRVSKGGKLIQPVKVEQQAIDQAWNDSTFSLEDMSNIFGPTDTGDAIPMASDSQELLDKTMAAYMKTEDYKRVFGDPDSQTSSEDSSAKSKSPNQGSDQSLPGSETKKEKDQFHVDLTVDNNALPELQGDFDDLFKDAGDWDMLEAEGSMSPFEIIEKTSDMKQAPVKDEFDLDSWIQEPLNDDSMMQDDMAKLLDAPINWDDLGDPSQFAGGTMEWNAIGKTGQEMRRTLGWPVEGAEGQKTRAGGKK